MSVLLLDAGNTRLKWALCERGQFLQRGVFTYEWSTLLAQFQTQWGDLAKRGMIKKLVLSNVAGERLESLLRQWWLGTCLQEKALQETGLLTIDIVQAQAHAFGVRCAYRQPGQLGADRWAALIAARHHITGACCVIACGTALTIDVLSAEGVHVGGLIAPGMAIMRQSLLASTTQITEHIEAGDATNMSIFCVRDTARAVQTGIMAATTGAVQQVLQQCHEHGQLVPVCVVTGGDAQVLLPTLPKGSLHGTEWVLKGLAIIAGCNK